MTDSDSRIAVYTGSFDPITLGHLNVIERASRLVDKLIVGIGINIEKQSLFSPEERVDLVRRSVERLKNVEVAAFSGLAVNFVRAQGARVLIRGVRSRSMMRSIRAGSGASTACGTSAGIRTMDPCGARTGDPPMVSTNEPASTITSASKGDVCSVSPCPASNANSVTLPPDVRASTRLAMPCSVGVMSE